ncbi:MATE family efflux transporter, partial [Vibrio sp.]|uniref:MATE family efflux transporter n=1 Tax=Vibrio sp. TaxID=678 RepID=UPI003AA7FC35
NILPEDHPRQLKAQARLFKLGFRVGAALFFEVTLFAVVALLVSPLGPIIVAAHQVAINFSTLVFMLPMGIGAAVSIRVGHKLGEESVARARVASGVGIMVGTAMTVVTAFLTVVFREFVAELYTSNQKLSNWRWNYCYSLRYTGLPMPYKGSVAGALRGYKDMRAIFNRTFVAY